MSKHFFLDPLFFSRCWRESFVYEKLIALLLSCFRSLSPSSTHSSKSSQQYSSTSKLFEAGGGSTAGAGGLSPNFSRRTRKISKSSEDVNSIDAGFRNVASKFLGVVELDPTTGDLKVRKGSLQKDLDVASHVLEEGAVETAAIIEKGVLNPFTKFTKGLGAVLKGQSEMTTGAISDNALSPSDVSPVRSSSSQNNQLANQWLQAKIDEANSQTKVLLL